MKKILLSMALASFAAAGAHASVEHLLPRVHQLEVTQAPGFALNRAVAVTDPTNCSWLTTTLGEIGLTADPSAQARLTVEVVDEIPGAFNHKVADYPDEAYSIAVAADEIKIKVLTPTGTIRAAQTLAQLAQTRTDIEAVNITDWPAFKVRGFMQDVGRSFLSVDELKEEIDLLSRFKVNTFHWHLTDYTGWRFEVKAYPELTGPKGITRYPGMYYTQDDAKAIQDYAAERGMTVIPEIDMPGHSHPFVNAMGHAMTTEQGKAELKVILTEVANVFDKAPYIHIGGDEISFDDSFLIEMIDYVHGLGKKVVIWNKYNRPAKAIDPKVIKTDMSTNWATSGTLTEGFPNIDMRYNYTNHFDVFADLVGIYKSSIFYVPQGNDNVGGTISAAWNDTKTPDETHIVRQNNIYANIIASGERAWIGGGEQYIETGGVTLPNTGSEYEEFADWERRFLFHKSTTMARAKSKIPYVKQTNVRWHLTDQIPNGGNASAKLAPEDYMTAETMPTSFDIDGQTYGVNTVTGAGIYLRHIWHGTVKGYYPNPQNNMTAYAWTNIYSETEQDAGAFIEFYTYSRSGNEKGPDAGKWDRRGSRIWLNGEEIPAPEWEQPGFNIPQDNDTRGLANENFTARPATKIHLKQGWNRVFLKLPHVNSGGTARDKWQFTFVVTDPDGNDALEGLVYSPMKCLNSADEELASKILEARALVNSNFKEAVGFYAPSDLSAALLAKADELQADLENERTEAERTAQIAELDRMISELNASLATASISQPEEGAYYYLSTPLRGSFYATAASGVVTGNTAASAEAAWKFEKRTDGSYNIVNHSTKQYISPTAANNTQLQLTATAPAAGWSVKPSDTTGYVIITSGSAQFNQTNIQNKVYNWGGGNNTSDPGCKYVFTLTDYVDGPVEPVEIPDPVFTILDRTLDGSEPLLVPADLSAPVLTAEATTAVLHLTATEVSNIAAYAAATDTRNNEYFSFVAMDGNRIGPRYMGLNKTEGWYTQNTDVNTNEVKVAIVCDPTVGYELYRDGSLIRTIALSTLGAYGHVHFGNVPEANALYIGGIVTNDSTNKYPLKASLHSARFWNCALTAEQIAALEYTGLTDSTVKDAIGSIETAADKAAAMFDLQGRRVAGRPAAGIYIVNGHKVLVK